MKFLSGKGYIDSKDYAGDCEPVVIMAKGQSMRPLLILINHFPLESTEKLC